MLFFFDKLLGHAFGTLLMRTFHLFGKKSWGQYVNFSIKNLVSIELLKNVNNYVVCIWNVDRQFAWFVMGIAGDS